MEETKKDNTYGLLNSSGQPLNLMQTEVLKEILKIKKEETRGLAQQGMKSREIAQANNFSLDPNTQGQGILQKLIGAMPAIAEVTSGGEYSQSKLRESQIQKNQQMQNNTKGVYGYDPVKGTVTQQATVPANADIRNMTPQTGIDTLPPEQQLPAYALARKIGGVRGAEKVLPSVIAGLKEGKSPDQLEDEIRMSQQSVGVTGEWRNAAQSVLGTKATETQRNVVLDALDDYRQSGDETGAKEYLKNISRESAPVDMQNRIMGKERTVDFLDEIQGDLDTLEKAGVGTGFLRGNIEGLLNRIGKTVAPEFREVATKIAVSIINYRNAMSGVAFGEKESADYRRLFPSTNKLGEFNNPTIKALKNSFSGDTKKFYQQRMGEGNYNKLFKEEIKGKTITLPSGKTITIGQ